MKHLTVQPPIANRSDGQPLTETFAIENRAIRSLTPEELSTVAGGSNNKGRSLALVLSSENG